MGRREGVTVGRRGERDARLAASLKLYVRRLEARDLPRISEFFGIVIYVYYEDHGPPHFHAQYGGSEAVLRIDGLSVARGSLPPRALGRHRMATLHRKDLDAVWHQAEQMQPLSKIAPLE